MENLTPFTTFQLLAVTLATILTAKLFAALYQQWMYWRKRGVPSVGWLPGLGSMWKVFFRLTAATDFTKYLYNYRPGAKYIGVMDMSLPTIVIRDPELIKDIGVKSFDQFPDHRSFITEEMDPIFGRNVFSLTGDRWREMRNTLSPFFTASKMRFMFDLVSKSSQEFVEHLYKHPELCSSMELRDAFTRYTNDVIATSAFGISVNSMRDRENEFYKAGLDITNFNSVLRLMKFILLRYIPRLMGAIGINWVPSHSREFLRNVISETVKLRDEQGVVRRDMIQLLIQARDQEKLSTHQLTIDDIAAQSFVFFLGGFDTSSTLMCFVALELALNQDVQERLREEVDEYLAKENGQISYESLTKMEYMEMVVSETLRKYPPLLIIDRVCSGKFQLPPTEPGMKSVTLNVNDAVWIPIYGLHHDPKYFPEPEKFDPERFSAENKDKINPYVYFPFGLGPRKCIGNRFALMETKIIMVHLLRTFIITCTEKTKPVVYKKGSFQLKPKAGFWIGLEKRDL